MRSSTFLQKHWPLVLLDGVLVIALAFIVSTHISRLRGNVISVPMPSAEITVTCSDGRFDPSDEEDRRFCFEDEYAAWGHRATCEAAYEYPQMCTGEILAELHSSIERALGSYHDTVLEPAAYECEESGGEAAIRVDLDATSSSIAACTAQESDVIVCCFHRFPLEIINEDLSPVIVDPPATWMPPVIDE